jgi:hypothetical protein
MASRRRDWLSATRSPPRSRRCPSGWRP